jgi:hypothetical protein
MAPIGRSLKRGVRLNEIGRKQEKRNGKWTALLDYYVHIVHTSLFPPTFPILIRFFLAHFLPSPSLFPIHFHPPFFCAFSPFAQILIIIFFQGNLTQK